MNKDYKKCFSCKFCKITKRGRAKAYAIYEILYHLEEHGSDHIKSHGEVYTANDVRKIIRTLQELGFFNK